MKNIFKYNNGEVDLFADPIAVDRKLRMALGDDFATLKALFEVDGDGKLTSSPLEFMMATEKQIAATRQAFGCQPFDPHTGKGATDDVVLELWEQFWNWMADQKKTPVTSPMQARFTAPSKTSQNSSASRGTTRPTLASG